jgi:hypothetical protein
MGELIAVIRENQIGGWIEIYNIKPSFKIRGDRIGNSLSAYKQQTEVKPVQK